MSLDPIIHLPLGGIAASETERPLHRRAMMWKGATEAYWRVPVKEHAKQCNHAHRANRKFELAKGLEEADGTRVFPGEEKYCRCKSAPIYPWETADGEIRSRPPYWNKFNIIVNLLTLAVGASIGLISFVVAHFFGR
nr:hypothetical protein HUO10_004872 [Paraburkholderia busanensis]